MSFGEPFVVKVPDPERMAGLPLSQLLSTLAGPNVEQAPLFVEEIFRRFEPLMRRTWLRLSGPVADYDDFRQEAFLKLFRALPKLRDPDAFPGFFRTVILNVARDQLRQLKPKGIETVPLDEAALLIPSQTPFADIDTGILVSSLLHALQGREREVLYFDAVLGLTPKETAHRLNLSAGAVRMTKSRAINRLRQLLTEKRDALEAKK